MAKLEKEDTIPMIVLTLIGLSFFIMASTVFKNLRADCPSFLIRNGWSFIQALGACLLTAGVSYFICVLRAEKCTASENVKTVEVYLLIIGLFALVILGIAIGMLKEYSTLKSQNKLNCDDKKGSNKRLTIFITVLSGLTLISCIGLMIKKHFETSKSA